uniref:(California timema) hypothetical protein n=1 Tax=Timema californicum TaxID=61474 RepID=A0A7R9PC81_TIMCA|nr:unnamed protein product [Timema californicum]
MLMRRCAMSIKGSKPPQTSPMDTEITAQVMSIQPFLDEEINTPWDSDYHHLQDAIAATTPTTEHLVPICTLNSTNTVSSPLTSYSPSPWNSPAQTPADEMQLTTATTSQSFTPGKHSRATVKAPPAKQSRSSEEVFIQQSTKFVELEVKARLDQLKEFHNFKLKQEAELYDLKMEVEKALLRDAVLTVELKEKQLANMNSRETTLSAEMTRDKCLGFGCESKGERHECTATLVFTRLVQSRRESG